MYPGTSSRSAGGYRCVCFAGTGFADQYYQNNTCLTADGVVYTYGYQPPPPNCSNAAIAPHVYVTARNTFFAPADVNLSATGELFGGPDSKGVNRNVCPGFGAWQATGQDAGSRVVDGLPSPADVVAMGRRVLGFLGQTVPN